MLSPAAKAFTSVLLLPGMQCMAHGLLYNGRMIVQSLQQSRHHLSPCTQSCHKAGEMLQARPVLRLSCRQVVLPLVQLPQLQVYAGQQEERLITQLQINGMAHYCGGGHTHKTQQDRRQEEVGSCACVWKEGTSPGAWAGALYMLITCALIRTILLSLVDLQQQRLGFLQLVLDGCVAGGVATWLLPHQAQGLLVQRQWGLGPVW